MHSVVLVLASLVSQAAPEHSKYVFVTPAGTIGTLVSDTTMTADGLVVDNDWRIDDNGRGSKAKEHVELGKNGLPRRWNIEGTSDAGAPVKESFVFDGGKASWTSLDDHGEAAVQDPLYLANNFTPWANGFFVRVLLREKDHRRAVLPGGTLRLEKIRDVEIGANATKETVTIYSLWGLSTAPSLIACRGDRFVADLAPGNVLVEEKHQSDVAELFKLAADLSGETAATLSAKLTHRIDAPLWLTNVRVFDPTAEKLSAPTNVGVFGETIVHVGGDPPPSDAYVVDGAGGTLLPGLLDSHAHLGDWDGPLHLAAGVTLGRDPGNDNETLLRLEQRIAAGEIMGPRMKNSGFLEGKSPYSAHLGFVIDRADEACEKVRWYADHGFWGIKIYNSMNPDFVKRIADEAHRLGLHVSGHVPAFMSSERAIRDGYDEINHINQLMLSFVIDPLKEDTRTPFRFTALGERMGKLDLQSEPVQRMLALMKERKTTLGPTLAIFSELLMARPGQACPCDAAWLDHMPIAVQRSRRSASLDVKPEQYPLYDASWKKLEATLRMLYEHGIPLVPGTDSFAGVVLHSELEAWVHAGIPASAALSAATLGGARFLGLDHELGTVARGKLADLYLVDGDPTQDIGAIRKGRLVLKGGAYYYPDEIHTALGITPFAPHATVQPPAATPPAN